MQAEIRVQIEYVMYPDWAIVAGNPNPEKNSHPYFFDFSKSTLGSGDQSVEEGNLKGSKKKKGKNGGEKMREK